jgi:hypothetical protein
MKLGGGQEALCRADWDQELGVGVRVGHCQPYS